VPVEKAFCPNCSEPIEPEEAPNRAKTSSSDMLATLRDDPKNYRELLMSLKKKPATEAAEVPSTNPEPGRSSPSVVGFSSSQIAPPPAPAKNNKRNLVFIISAIFILILLFVLLRVFKIV
jgi:predicted nucleic acid-binding Zn ribbon protein